MTQNDHFHKAKRNKNDDFYTQLPDIEKELRHYRKHFNGKVVYCNCDDPRVSNFFHYFSYNFEELGLRKLIATCYKNQQMDLFSQGKSKKAIWMEYEGTRNENEVPSIEEIGVNNLEGDGDFRSKECIELLKQSDIIVTNPPFSLFREYVAQLMEYDKKFLIIGNMNATAYREIFSLLKRNRVWLGVDNCGTKWFELNPDYDIRNESRKKIENGKKYFSMGNVVWYTNLDHSKRHEEIVLYKKYSPDKYPKYDNYDAIEVAKAANIPIDYDGSIGVPITFLDKHNPDQFEIVGIDRALTTKLYGKQSRFILNGKEIGNYIQ